jgi:hypothetical protein
MVLIFPLEFRNLSLLGEGVFLQAFQFIIIEMLVGEEHDSIGIHAANQFDIFVNCVNMVSSEKVIHVLISS